MWSNCGGGGVYIYIFIYLYIHIYIRDIYERVGVVELRQGNIRTCKD